jgi:hypothetical protein
MKAHILTLTTAFAMVGTACVIALAPAASADPTCINTGPNTTQCSTPGHTQIVTGPPPDTNPYNGWPAWGWGGIGIRW